MAALGLVTLVGPTVGSTVFNPIQIDSSGVAKWASSAASFDERLTLTQQLRFPKVGGSVIRCTAKLSIPLMDSETPPKKVGESIVNVEFVLPKGATAETREDLRVMMAQFLHGFVFDTTTEGTALTTDPLGDAVDDLANVY